MEARFRLRPALPADATALATLIRTVMPEFGCSGVGFAILDPEVDDMPAAYALPQHAYFVIEADGVVVGGGGIAPLAGGRPGVCELRKMYLYPRARGHGQGRRLLSRCLQAARALGFSTCYLETTEQMAAARGLYAAFGFRPLEAPMGATGHSGCDRYYALTL